MDVREISHAARLTEWQERIRACRTSELSVTRWCEENGINSKTYYRWERRCLGEAAIRLGYADKNPGLIRVNPDQLPEGYTRPDEAVSPGMECVIRCGQILIEINAEMPVSRIADLVGALNNHA